MGVEFKKGQEPLFQHHYYRRARFKSSHFEEGRLFFERYYNENLHVGQVKVLRFHRWTILLANALRTFSRRRRKKTPLFFTRTILLDLTDQASLAPITIYVGHSTSPFTSSMTSHSRYEF